MNTTKQSVADLTALLEAAKKNERLAEGQQRERMRELYKKFHATKPYIYEVCDARVSGWVDVEVKDAIYVSRKIDIIAYGLFTCNLVTEEQKVINDEDLAASVGMQYYLTADGIIHNTGGGTLILKTPQLCSLDEWEQIKSGNIPAKFLRKGAK